LQLLGFLYVPGIYSQQSGSVQIGTLLLYL